ncbi:hypothetical protein PV08_01940 [Exophiala spinifera]|uniref:NB-ARC domain-containing protein n=1 Tax=Exophiala spinifera TaxID=91928 RepID=A0A0D2BSF2_9EURO|nr:uncharacterized protein PV08_01940 [Exophiala spinifera]KIW21360.1 hypothetical protein PV08_01940 [Exophiala spinifera]
MNKLIDETFPIRATTRVCRQRFRDCASQPLLAQGHWAENRLSEFNRWDSGVGASANNSNSLDKRLERNLSAHKVVLGALAVLAVWITKCSELAEGTTSVTSPTDSLSHRPAQASALSSEPNTERSETSTLSEAKGKVEGLLKSLADLAIAIRRAGTVSRLRRADRTFDGHKDKYQELSEHLEFILRVSEFPRFIQPTSSETSAGDDTGEIDVRSALIQLRGRDASLRIEQQILVLANLKRHHRFLFYRGRQKQLLPEQPPKGQSLPFQLRSPLPDPSLRPHHIEERAEIPSQVSTDAHVRVPPAQSQQYSVGTTNKASDYAPSLSLEKDVQVTQPKVAATTIALRADYPKPPRDNTKCPYCLIPLESEAEDLSQWKKHASEDLQPYTCYLPICPQDHPFFSTFGAWKAHVTSNEHRQFEGWTCLLCNFSSKPTEESAFLDHIRDDHANAIAEEAMIDFATMCRRYNVPTLDRCPVCSTLEKDWGVRKSKDRNFDRDATSFLEHLGQCLHSFSLRVLPETEPEKANNETGQKLTEVSHFEDRSWPSGSLRVSHHTDGGLTETDLAVFSEVKSNNQVDNLVSIQTWLALLEETSFEEEKAAAHESQIELTPQQKRSLMFFSFADKILHDMAKADEVFMDAARLDTPSSREEYRIACFCSTEVELRAAWEMLEERHPPLPTNQNRIDYALGKLGGHNVVIVSLPSTPSLRPTELSEEFPALRFYFFVGLAGGVPRGKNGDDIRLGDVVIAYPVGTSSGVVKLVLGDNSTRVQRVLRPLPAVLRQNIELLAGDSLRMGSRVSKILSEMVQKRPEMEGEYSFPGLSHDRLFQADYPHSGAGDCQNCDKNKIIERHERRLRSPMLHYGTIGLTSHLLEDAIRRDSVTQLADVKCIGMDTGWQLIKFPTALVICGISDYADSHKNARWQPYAAASAVAYLKELLSIISPAMVEYSLVVADVLFLFLTFEIGLCLFDAPMLEDRFRVNRRSEIEQIANLLKHETTPLSPKYLAVAGPEGTGKTQLAIAYAERYQQRYTSILWLDASSEQRLGLSIRRCVDLILSRGATNNMNEPEIRNCFFEWLERSDNGRWLLIFDDYKDDLFYGAQLVSYFQGVAHGSILVTARNQEQGIGQSILLRSMGSEDEGAKVLLRRGAFAGIKICPITVHYGSLEVARAVRVLGGRLFCLAIAGAFVSQAYLTFSLYSNLVQERLGVHRRYPANIANRTIAVLDISFEYMQKRFPHAAQLISFFGYLDRHDIWFELLQSCRHHDQPQWFSELVNDRSRFGEAMRSLIQFGLVEMSHQTGSYSLHSCVYDWVLNKLNREIDEQQYWLALDCVVSSRADVWLTTYHERLISHATWLAHDRFQVLIKHAPRESIKMAKKVYLTVLSSYETMLPGVWDDPENARVTRRLVELYSNQNKVHAAGEIYERALRWYANTLGEHHPESLSAMSDYGSFCLDHDQLERAEGLFRKVLVGYEKTRGPDDLSTLDSMKSLASICNRRSKYNEAKEMYQKALSGYEKTLGAHHAATLLTMLDLAKICRDMDELDEGEALCTQAILALEKTQGEESPQTIPVMTLLGDIYREQGDTDLAAGMYWQTFALSGKALGPDHPSTLSVRVALGNILFGQNNLDQAEEMYSSALKGYEKTHGAAARTTLDAVLKLSMVYRGQKRIKEACEMARRALEGYEKILGPEAAETREIASVLKDLTLTVT